MPSQTFDKYFCLVFVFEMFHSRTCFDSINGQHILQIEVCECLRLGSQISHFCWMSML
jgi:hypothetical protein